MNTLSLGLCVLVLYASQDNNSSRFFFETTVVVPVNFRWQTFVCVCRFYAMALSSG